ncbi:MAG: adenosylcobinamide-GDP ribazoletransferase [Deltaproteobacteria bacterium]|nr:MAG: adenosylcobinamide-GDP ribazoletransferase [Deltaproteobacteria bacterium]
MSSPAGNTAVRGLGTALRTLTLLPWPFGESEDLAASLPWFPVVGLILGMILYGVAVIWSYLPFVPWPAAAGLALLVCEVILTRGLHVDGLADWADSIGGGADREKRLAIMKDASIGAFGVTALVLDLLAKWICFERLFATGALFFIPVILLLSRNALVELACALPYARTGTGMGLPFVEGATRKHLWVSRLLTVTVCLILGLPALLLFCISCLETLAFAFYSRRRFGGITGDLLGTANEIVEGSLLLLCALFPFARG